MRTTIDIDDALLAQAMTVAALPTKRAAVKEGLRSLVQVCLQAQAIGGLQGLGWDGDLDEMRGVAACQAAS